MRHPTAAKRSTRDGFGEVRNGRFARDENDAFFADESDGVSDVSNQFP
jgi:hypothetical protein